jgi:peptidoglycan/xylan/chitin deacetylase (PgdA/CDA1 family)
MKPLFAALSPAGPAGCLSTLIFHRVLDRPDPLFPEEIDAARFDTLCGWLRNWFNVLPLDEAVQRLAAGTLPARAAAITFDDGYEDNHRVALPILERHGLNATFFVSTGFLDGGCMWNDVVIEALRAAPGPRLDLRRVEGAELGEHALPDAAARRAAIDAVIGRVKYLEPTLRLQVVHAVAQAAGLATLPQPMMQAAQVKALADRGMRVGAHTVQHPILARLPDGAALSEISQGKARLEAIVGRPVTLFAYPNGKPGTDYSAATVALARRAGFAAAVSTAWGVSRQDTCRFQLPRFTPWDRGRLRFALRLAANMRRVPQLLDAPAEPLPHPA